MVYYLPIFSLSQETISQTDGKIIEWIWVITTNDNLRALSFYQKQDFVLLKIYPNAMDRARKIKPFIPDSGKNKIPLRDMIGLEMRF